MEQKTVLSPSDSKYMEHYKIFIEQMRKEVDNQNWQSNFFFLVNSTLMVLFFKGEFKSPEIQIIVPVFGLLLSVLWTLIATKQKRWRKYWIRKIAALDVHLDDKFRMWPDRKKEPAYKDIFINRGRIPVLMLFLPMLFIANWLYFLIF